MEAIVLMLVALIELVITVVAMVIAAIFEGAMTLAGKPPEGQKRFSKERILAAFLPLVAVVVFLTVVGLSIYGYSTWKSGVHDKKRDETRELVAKQTRILTNQLDENGDMIKHPNPTLDVKDLWGNPLYVRYEQSLTEQKVTVGSAAFDQKVGTWDDIKRSLSMPRKKKEIAKDLIGKAKDKFLEKFKKDEAEEKKE